MREAGSVGAAVQVGQAQQLPCGVDGGEEGVGDAVERQVVALAAVVGRVEDVVERRREVVAGQLVVEPRAGPLIARAVPQQVLDRLVQAEGGSVVLYRYRASKKGDRQHSS